MRAPTILVAKGACDPGALVRRISSHDVYEFTDLTDVVGPARRAELIVIRSGTRLGADQLAALPNLRHVVRAGSGLDGIDTVLLDERGIGLHRNPEASAQAVAEWCLAALLCLARRIPLGAQGLASGDHLKAACTGTPLASANVAIWGAGPVGRAAAAILAPFVGEIVFAARPSITDLPQMPADDLPGWADVHIVALPATAENTALLDSAFLHAAAGRAPLLVVVGRLATIDTEACLQALTDGHLSGLAVDPVETADAHHFRTGPKPLNLLATPHIGAQRRDVRRRLDDWVTDTARALLLRPAAASVNELVDVRVRAAGEVASQLAEEYPSSSVWMTGPVACGFAHARSDVDLRVLFPAGPVPVLQSRIVDGVRVDLEAQAMAEVDELRGLLGQFHILGDDVDLFRTARRRLAALTVLRTARAPHHDGQPLLDEAERDVYRRWALADRIQHAISLVEDLDGLMQAGLTDAADLVARQLQTTVQQAENTAAGHPLLGDKWTPVLAAGATPSPPTGPLDQALRQARARLLAALLEVWPESAEPHGPVPSHRLEPGWLPQRYSDGWRIKRADATIRLTPGQLAAWQQAIHP
ncbi:NAD(P)-dependent oxidoreductase [Kitasatospora sp. NPDC056184]|uniref:NAD(P)-dependent oxidoreductase n=1 Tax=Kitasatospora sp. NPDC056184 TaxID=3345738 RepID=UPI0035D63A2E